VKIKNLEEQIKNIDPNNLSKNDLSLIEFTIQELDKGNIRVASHKDNEWLLNEWVRDAILLFFSIRNLKEINANDLIYYDKLEPKKNYKELGIRVVPPGVVRYGAFCEPGVVVMPGFVNIGAYVGSGTMVDTWATVGSCAQIGKNVHLSGGVGIGGVLEPAGAMPVVVEDGAFIGSRSIIVEGVRIKKGAVIGANVTLTASTPIIDVTGKVPVEVKGVVEENSVVIPGTRPKEFPSGVFNTPCALIIGKRKESTDEKTSLTDALRTFGVEV
jgi:2,3,4,5-tetrahydropyridine-2-carboxylate N-succinyltransferase